jgi:hypothetical protein
MSGTANSSQHSPQGDPVDNAQMPIMPITPSRAISGVPFFKNTMHRLYEQSQILRFTAKELRHTRC